jgi:uncharacterized protein (DUF302 family)
MAMSYGMTKTVARPFVDVVADVRSALADQGFGVITEIDMKATLKKKIDVDIDDQVILGACSPSHAYQALQADESIGLLLPCNVTVRASGDSTIIEMINPQTMVDLSSSPAMAGVADEVGNKLRSALEAITD